MPIPKAELSVADDEGALSFVCVLERGVATGGDTRQALAEGGEARRRCF
jgi:hypothetical protein